jgi:hypothetical protein
MRESLKMYESHYVTDVPTLFNRLVAVVLKMNKEIEQLKKKVTHAP